MSNLSDQGNQGNLFDKMFQCFIKLDRKTIVFNSHQIDTIVQDMKQFIEDTHGILTMHQNLLYAGKMLKNDTQVVGNILENSTLFLCHKFQHTTNTTNHEEFVTTNKNSNNI